jgi:26S proteasome regulatory subunit N7
LAKADYLANIGEKALSIEAYQKTLEKAVGSGRRIDIMFSLMRVAMLWNDTKLIKDYIQKTKAYVEEGGDWERRNLLGVYEATYFVMIREWKEAANLFLKSIATFTAHELYSYETLIFYTVISSVVMLDRPTLREKVINSPDILTVIRDIPNLRPFLFSLYECKYNQFFVALAKIIDQVKRDIYFSAHSAYFLREIRIVAYTQFLESYRSVTFTSMAQAFGVSPHFLDSDLSRFIASGRLNCKIDKVGGIVETNRPDARNLQYSGIIKQGDLLLNRVQKLAQVLSHMR